MGGGVGRVGREGERRRERPGAYVVWLRIITSRSAGGFLQYSGA